MSISWIAVGNAALKADVRQVVARLPADVRRSLDTTNVLIHDEHVHWPNRPCIANAGRHDVWLDSAALVAMPREARQFVIAHELSHVLRQDVYLAGATKAQIERMEGRANSDAAGWGFTAPF